MSFKPKPLPTRKEGQTNAEWYDDLARYRDEESTRLVLAIQGKQQRNDKQLQPREDWQSRYDK